MDTNYISPYIRVAMDSIINPPWKLEERVIFDYELLYIKEGNVIITVEDAVYEGKTGDVFLFKPKQRHSIKPVDGTRFRQPHLHFDLFYQADSPEVKVSFKSLNRMTQQELNYFRDDVTQNSEMVLPNKLPIRNIEYFEKMLFEIISEYEKKRQFYEIIIKGLFLKLWAFLLSEYHFFINPKTFSKMDELERVKEYIRNNLETQINLDDLAKQFKISKYHLLRNFSNAFGITPIHYCQMLRIEKAKEYIIYGNWTMTEISERLGFNSINAFSRTFKNIDGVSPSFYRRK